MPDVPEVQVSKNSSGKAVASIVVSPWMAILGVSMLAAFIRAGDIERLNAADEAAQKRADASDIAGQKRADGNLTRIVTLEAGDALDHREDVARDQRALRVELAVASFAGVQADLGTTVKELTASIQRLNLELASMRAARGGSTP